MRLSRKWISSGLLHAYLRVCVCTHTYIHKCLQTPKERMNTFKPILNGSWGRKIYRASHGSLLQSNFLCRENWNQTSVRIVQFNMVNQNVCPSPCLFCVILLKKMIGYMWCKGKIIRFHFRIGFGMWMSKLKSEISLAEKYFAPRLFRDLSHLK